MPSSQINVDVLPVGSVIQSMCFASVNQRAGARTWPIRRQLRPAAQSCRLPCLQEGALRQWQGNRHHCLPVFDGLYLQSVGKAEYRHAKVIGFGSLSHRAGGAIASSVTMRPRESLRFVTEAHRHFSPVREAGCVSQPQRRCTAIAESRQMKASASQDGSQSAVALGVGLGSLAHRGWLPSSTAVGDPQLRQSYITPHCIQCPPVSR